MARHLDEAMKKKLQEIADAEDRSIGSVIRIILREALEAREAKARKPSTES
jgi:predicted transcriptional regulator